jgi:DUF1365 family protein
MNSCLYHCRVMHDRLEPMRNKFNYNLFMFYLDLDEIDALVQKIPLLSHNRFNIFNFRDSDHLQFGGKTTKENIIFYLRDQGVDLTGGRIMLMTHLRMFGHVFNPVSFYFCFDAAGTPVCVVPEVGNTFREMKAFFIGRDRWAGKRFEAVLNKYFYVSPFIPHDTAFEFKLAVPGERLSVAINDLKEGRRFFLSSLTGERRALTTGALALYALRFPLITLQILGLIHWQAVKLMLRRLPYFRKADHPELQRGYQHVPHR